MKKEKILIADDSEMNRSILADMLEDSYEIIEATDGVEATAILNEHASELSLLLLDIVMPRMDGFGVLEEMKRHNWIEAVPVVIISSENSSAHIERAYELGVTDFIARPFDALIVRKRVVNTLLLYAKQKRLINLVEDQIYEQERQGDLMIDILSHVMEFRNGESGLHILHVRMFTDFLLGCLSKKTDRYELTERKISMISMASALHDIGKMAIDEKILNKPGKLTNEEFAIMKTHSALGAQMISQMPIHQQEPIVRCAYEICRWHHERFDGRGYPDGLAGDDIPISAQVVAMADVYDALTSERVYKPPFSHDEAIKMIVNGECGTFNPLLIECLKENVDKLRDALDENISDEQKRHKLRRLSEEKLREEGGGVSKRTLRLLDRERIKNSFFATMTEATQFEYTVNPQMLTVSVYGAKKLGVDEIIMNPADDPKVKSLLGEETWELLSGNIRSTTPENPEIKLDCPLHYKGSTRWNRITMRSTWSDDDVPQFEGALGIILDIHDSHLKMLELEKKAARDPMTGLLNRVSARERMELRMTDRPDSRYALAMTDVDFLKQANDVHGHQFGDKLIKTIATRMRDSIRASDISCRAGGDEFMIFLEYKTDIERTVDRIFHSICGDLDGFPVSVSMGIALSDDIGLSFDDLYRAADTACYAAKRSGKGRYVFYDDSLKGLLDADKREREER